MKTSQWSCKFEKILQTYNFCNWFVNYVFFCGNIWCNRATWWYSTTPKSDGWAIYYTKKQLIYIIGGNDGDGLINQYEIFEINKERIIGHNKLLDYIAYAPSLIVNQTDDKNDQIMLFGGYGCNDKTNKSCNLVSSIQFSDLPLSKDVQKASLVYIQQNE